jgi:translation initiation factor 3 subunit B
VLPFHLRFLFVTLSSQAAAEDAAKRLSDAFDRKHTFTCITLSSIDELQEMPDEFEAPEEDSDQFKPKEHLKGWLLDSQARDQMVLVRGDDVQISWNHKGHKMEIDHERKVSTNQR